ATTGSRSSTIARARARRSVKSWRASPPRKSRRAPRTAAFASIASSARRSTTSIRPSSPATSRSAPSIEGALLAWNVEREGRNLHLEGASRLVLHRIVPGHDAGWSRQRAARGILEAVPGVEFRLLADDPGAVDELDPAGAVRDLPVARQKLDELVRLVGDGDPVGPDVAVLGGIGPVIEEERLDAHLYVARHGPVHRCIPFQCCCLPMIREIWPAL